MPWIEVPGWERFQHYGLARRPLWIKNYTTLLHKDEYLDLTLSARGLLHGIWLAYADADGQLSREHCQAIVRGTTREKQWQALSQAGLIDFVASKPLHLSVRPTDARENEPVDNSTEGQADLRIVRASKRERLHETLLGEARKLTGSWKEGGSDRFDHQLDMLERKIGSRLTFTEREQLWEATFGH